MRSQLHHLAADAARRAGDAPAVTYKDATLTYVELWRDLRTVAAGLRRLGLKRGERVGVYLDKRLETVTALFGCSAASGVFVPINPVLRQKQVAYILDDCSCRMLITTPERLELLREQLRLVSVARARDCPRCRTGGLRRAVHGDDVEGAAAGCAGGRAQGPGRSRSRHGARSSTPRAAPASPRAWWFRTGT